MSWIIYIDDAGNEVSRKEKSRGRPPKGEVMPNGDIKVKMTVDIETPKVKAISLKPTTISAPTEVIVTEEVTGENVQIETGEVVPVIRKRRTIKGTPTVTPEDLIRAFLLGKEDIVRTPEGITISKIYVLRKLGGVLENVIKFDGIITRLYLDLENNLIKGWYFPSSTASSRISSRRGRGEILEEADLHTERERGEMFVDPADFEIEGSLIIEKENDENNGQA